jgi:hypothetical protein
MCAYGELSVVNGKLMIDDPLRGQIELEDRFDKGVIPGYGKKYAQLLADVKAAQAAGKPMRCQFCSTVTTDAVNNAGMVASISSAQCGLPPPSKDELLGELPKISNMRYDATKCTWYWETCSKYTYTLKPGVVYPSGLDVMPKERNPFKNEEPDPPQILGSYSGTPPDVTLTPLTCFWTGGKGAVPGEKQLTMRDSLTGKKFALTGSNQQLLKQIQDGAKNQDHMRICGLLNKDGSLSVMAVKKYGGPNAIPKGNGMSVASPCLIVGKLSKDDEGNYYITDPTTGAMFQVKPSDDEKKKMDKWLVKPDCKDAPYSLNLCEDKQIPVKPSVGGNPPVIDLTQQVGALPANPVGVAGATGPEGPVGTVASGGGVSTKTVVIVTTSLAAVGLITGIVVNEESGGKQPASPE